jgi:outer membrane protein OmpA-like peptidoglycan-associated protein
MMSDTIDRQTASYRQGLVLGLTMAEIMLLLVFCLLIAVGVSLTSERAKRDAALARLKQVETVAAANDAALESIRRNARLAELLDRAAKYASQREIDDFWRKLVDSSDAVSKMEQKGVSLAALQQDSEYAAKLRQLMREGIDPDKIARSVALAAAIEAVIADKKLGELTPQEIAALLDKGLAAAAAKAADDSDSKKGRHDWPPIINLSEAGGYYFATGSAELTPNFAAELRTVVVDRLLEIAESYDVDVIEVIGHTDEQAVNGRASNLDRALAGVTTGSSGAGVLQWADNAGLGLARALSVVERLSADSRLRNFRILPLSAAQLIGTDGKLTRWDSHGDVRERRRIEIRMRKSV